MHSTHSTGRLAPGSGCCPRHTLSPDSFTACDFDGSTPLEPQPELPADYGEEYPGQHGPDTFVCPVCHTSQARPNPLCAYH